jgi:hypothetical protein
MSNIQIDNIENIELTDATTAKVFGGYGGGCNTCDREVVYTSAPTPVPYYYPVPARSFRGGGFSRGADPFIFDEIGPGNSRRDRFVVSPNGDTFQFNRKGNSKRSFTYNPGFNRGGF